MHHRLPFVIHGLHSNEMFSVLSAVSHLAQIISVDSFIK
jgi:hypothetical protein